MFEQYMAHRYWGYRSFEEWLEVATEERAMLIAAYRIDRMAEAVIANEERLRSERASRNRKTAAKR